MFYLWLFIFIARLANGQNDYICKAGHAAVLAGDKLVIDGGLAAYSARQPSYDNRTWIIDLSESWTNASVQPVSIFRPRTDLRLRDGSLWYDPNMESVYSLGGEISRDGGTVKSSGSTAPLEDSLWQFKFNRDQTSGTWSEALGPQGRVGPFPSNISRSISGATANDGTHAYYIGSRTSKWSTTKAGNTSLHTLPGLVTFDFATVTLENSTNDGSYFASKLGEISTEKTVSLAQPGLMTYVPPFGTRGIFVIVGGLEIDDNGQYKQWSNNVTIFNPSTKLWHYQRATGDIPEMLLGRSYCAFGAHDSSLSTYDIFLFGHFASGSTFYVLSLPSFTWHATNLTTPGRTDMTCTSTKSRQAIIVGGTSTDQASYPDPQNWEKQDPWTKGIHVFDMTALDFADEYDAHAPPYEASDLVRSSYSSSQYRFPLWDDPALEPIFNTPAHAGTSQLSAGVIAGIVVGALMLVALLGCFIGWRISKRRKLATTNSHGSHSGGQRIRPTPPGSQEALWTAYLQENSSDNSPSPPPAYAKNTRKPGQQHEMKNWPVGSESLHTKDVKLWAQAVHDRFTSSGTRDTSATAGSLNEQEIPQDRPHHTEMLYYQDTGLSDCSSGLMLSRNTTRIHNGLHPA